ncbi:MAG TPA: RNA polymerase sigma factor [Candidatus Anaerotruncus excrementipullorum]|uniref:RNA polymerase sigma factor n=1 Tax=Candidatus Anaerotruncus excrementipullorum TaxID=2838465 RepID=A0A9D2B7N6_9FIRM|nr:RNA polymerase sigma factor [Candidatus Anaerotruncus excrementipullorum]
MLLWGGPEKDRDQSKFEQLYLTYRQLMYHVAYGVLRDPQLSEDAVHQAFMRILNHLGKISEVDCPKTKSFVVIIVKNIAINLYNSRKRRAVLSLDEMEGWTGGAAPSPQQSVEDQEGALALAALLERMPEGYRSVLLLKYDNGYSTGEIADMLGLTEENVKKRIQRARKKLEELLQEEVSVP